MLLPFDTERRNSAGGAGEERISRGSAIPYRKVAEPQRSPVGSLLFMHIHTSMHTKFDTVTHVGRGLVFRGQPCTHPKGAGSQRFPIFGFLCIYVYTLYRLQVHTGFLHACGNEVRLRFPVGFLWVCAVGLSNNHPIRQSSFLTRALASNCSLP